MEERLQKIIAAAGIASRRKAEELILAGQVSVNGKTVRELGTKADLEKDHVKVSGKLISAAKASEKIYILLNKPVGYLTSRSDPSKRQLVIDLVGQYRNRVHPVGRLDLNTEGLILLTNDGEFTNLIAHASHNIAKVYEVKVKGKPSSVQISKISRGVEIDKVKTAPAKIVLMEETETNAWYEVTLHEGRNQQIRKMFDSIGHSVVKLRRVAIGFLKNEKLKPGELRFLNETEVKRFFKTTVKKSSAKSAKATKTTTGSRFDKA
ncbi:MAG: pseudouridine synthase [Acidobacteriota bacterium]|nr:pseudouridine synthase [Acidobacteriota bacterium]